MKPPVPLLAPLLRSNMQGEILAALLLQPDREFTMTELSTLTSSAPSQVHGEVTRLTTAGWALDRRVGRSRLIRAATEHSMYQPMVQILELSYGPLVVLPEILARVGRIREAYIYGSWAARYVGEGRRPLNGGILRAPRATQRWQTLGTAYLVGSLDDLRGVRGGIARAHRRASRRR